jgi:hypothetical protein
VLGIFYIFAKLTETFDQQIFSLGQGMSGHTIKHILAVVGSYWILRMLERRGAHSLNSSSGKLSAVNQFARNDSCHGAALKCAAVERRVARFAGAFLYVVRPGTI